MKLTKKSNKRRKPPNLGSSEFLIPLSFMQLLISFHGIFKSCRAHKLKKKNQALCKISKSFELLRSLISLNSISIEIKESYYQF